MNSFAKGQIKKEGDENSFFMPTCLIVDEVDGAIGGGTN